MGSVPNRNENVPSGPVDTLTWDVIEELDAEEMAAVRAVRSRRPLRFISGAELMALADPPAARISDGVILCDGCEEPADTLHLIPWTTQVEEVKAACPNHDFGGYWFEISTLAGAGFADWLLHLSGKATGGGVVALLRWLGHAGVAIVERAPDGVEARP
jgi:hypothetical protein